MFENVTNNHTETFHSFCYLVTKVLDQKMKERGFSP